jgi:hypothetical protein
MASFVTRTIGDVVAEFVMTRTTFDGSLLVLEGDSDSKFWVPRIDRQHCQVVIAGGKPTVEGAVIRANEIPLAGILGIVDDDYDSPCAIAPVSQNVLRTDSRDVETMLLKSSALDKLIAEICDEAKVAAFRAAEGTSVRDALVARSLPFGKLRWLDRLKGWKFDFEKLSPFRFADTANWSIDEGAVLATVAADVGLTVAELSAALAQLSVTDPYTVLHGKDTTAVLAIGLRSRLANQQHPAERVCQMLRLAYDDTLANATDLFGRVRAWETNNAPFRVLKRPA